MVNARIGAVFFFLWGLLHVAGGAAILASLSDGVAEGYAFYANAEGVYPAAAGAILGYNSFAILWIGLTVSVVAVFLNWKNDRAGAYINFALAGLSDLGLVFFLLAPGFVSLAGGSIGISLFALAVVFTILGRRAAKAL